MTVSELPFCKLVKVARKLRKDLYLAVLRKIETYRPGSFFHCRSLCRSTDTRDRKTDIHCGTLPRVEKIAFKEKLTVGDGYYVRRYIRRDVARLCFDYRQSRHAAAAETVGKLRRALEQS